MSHIDRTKTRPGTTRRVRLVGYDYSYPGYYFLTMCAFERQALFGVIASEKMTLSASGDMINDLITESEQRFGTVSVDCSVVMPNHIHLLLGMSVRLSNEQGQDTVSDIVKWFKSASVRRYGLGVKNLQWPRYQGRLWQQGFHDHIVRNERELETLRAYVRNNVYMWEKDSFYDG